MLVKLPPSHRLYYRVLQGGVFSLAAVPFSRFSDYVPANPRSQRSRNVHDDQRPEQIVIEVDRVMS